MISVCLLTCDRRQYTERTLASFAQHNDLSKFRLLHGDDASIDPAVPELAQDYGFHTVVQTTTREGWLPMRRQLFQVAARRRAEWVLFLENDHEWVRPFPWGLFEFVKKHAEIGCLRLQGKYKARDGSEPCMVYHKLNRNKPVRWMRLKYAPEQAQATLIHWSAQPSVTRVDDLLHLHERGKQSERLTARVVENVTYHIGSIRTHELPAPMPLEVAS